MSLFNRIAGTEEPKVPIWPIMMDFTRVLDQEPGFGISELAVKYELTQTEVAQAGEYLTHLGGMVVSRATELVQSGLSPELASEVARAVVDAKFRHGLMRAEQGTSDEATFRSNLGIED